MRLWRAAEPLLSAQTRSVSKIPARFPAPDAPTAHVQLQLPARCPAQMRLRRFRPAFPARRGSSLNLPIRSPFGSIFPLPQFSLVQFSACPRLPTPQCRSFWTIGAARSSNGSVRRSSASVWSWRTFAASLLAGSERPLLMTTRTPRLLQCSSLMANTRLSTERMERQRVTDMLHSIQRWRLERVERRKRHRYGFYACGFLRMLQSFNGLSTCGTSAASRI